MAAALATAPASPSSLQLRSSGSRRGSHVAFLRIRLRRAPARLVLAAASEESPSGRSWVASSDPPPDPFAGWSASENGGRGWLGGIIGVGLAGVFFAAGITFASISLRSRNSSGVKPQMEHLTTEQELLVTSDNHGCLKVNQTENEQDPIVKNNASRSMDCSTDCETGIVKEPFSSMEIHKDNQTIMDEIHYVETESLQGNNLAGDAVANIQKASSEDDPHIIPEVDNISIVTSSDPNLPGLPASMAVDLSSAATMSKDTLSHNTTAYTAQIKQTVDLGNTTPVDLPFLDTDPTNHILVSEEDNFSTETETYNPPLESSSGSEVQPSSEALSSKPLILELSDPVNSQLSSKDVMDIPSFVLNHNATGQSDMLQLPDETNASLPVVNVSIETIPSIAPFKSDFDQGEELTGQSDSISSPSEENKLGEIGPDIAHSLSELADPNVNETEVTNHVQMDRGFLFDSLLRERPFSSAGIPAPSLVSAASQVTPGKVVVPPVVDNVQGQAVAALQVLKVMEADVQPGDLCTRRDYARWLVTASSALSRNMISKVHPAMYIENVTELAFDDIIPEDPDFPYIQGLAEAGLISSKLSRSDNCDSFTEQQQVPALFSPESPLSRQDLVSWKMALERRQLPDVNRDCMYRCSGYIDIDKINPDAWPALVADLSAGDQSITALAFGYTRLFQPDKPVTKAQAAIALATGEAAEFVSEELTRIEAESLAESAVNAHTALVAQVEKDLHASFEKELAEERKKIHALEKLADEARLELERLGAEREEENNALLRGRAAVESEMEVLSRLRHEVEEQLQSLMSNKMEISFEKDRINKLRKEAESENQVIIQLQYELEVERKALSMARAWAEEEAKRAREQTRALEEARGRWQRQGIKVVVDEGLQDDASIGVTWATAGEQPQVDETINRGEKLLDNLKAMATEMKMKSSKVIEQIMQRIISLLSALKQRAFEASTHVKLQLNAFVSKASHSTAALQEKASELSSNVGDSTRRVIEDCRVSVEKITQKFKT